MLICYTYVYMYDIYVQSADVRFAVLQLISAARNELGLIRDQKHRYALRNFALLVAKRVNGLNARRD